MTSEPFIVLDLLCGDGNVSHSLVARKKAGLLKRIVRYIGVDGRNVLPSASQYVQGEYHKLALNFKNQDVLKRQLEEVLNRRQPHEIYLVMPHGETFHEQFPIQTLNGLLRRNGRLYVVLDIHGKLQPHKLARINDANSTEFQENLEKLKGYLSENGFKLEKYGAKAFIDNWTVNGRSPLSTSRLNARFRQLVQFHTNFADSAYHFFIAKKD